jgi:protein required for attachment to host cells
MHMPDGTLILVADGTHMLLLRNQGSAHYPDLKTIDHSCFTNLPDRELASDVPGVVHESTGPDRSTYGGVRRHQEKEDSFAIRAAHLLNEAVWLSGASAIVIAPPRTLAILRRHYEKTLKEKLIAEIDKNLIHCTVSDIAARLSQIEPRKRPVLSLRPVSTTKSLPA